jgi:hypothetical protein
MDYINNIRGEEIMYCPDCGAGINAVSRICKFEIVDIRDRTEHNLPPVASIIVTNPQNGHEVCRFTSSPSPGNVGEYAFVEACMIHGFPRTSTHTANWIS